jgi:5-(carboxyamino)imidazole ribonucleotide synthase
MMAAPAIELGLELHILAEGPEVSAAAVSAFTEVGDYTDLPTLQAFVEGLDVMTFDHEHVPSAHLQALEAAGVNVQPPSKALTFAQDKLQMRRRMAELGLPNPAWAPVSSVEDIVAFGESTGWPVVVKTPRGGYDGKGVLFVRTPEDAAGAAEWFDDFSELLVEEGVQFSRELSALVARRPSGDIEAWDIAHTIQTNGVCDEVVVPAQDLDPQVAARAQEVARTIARELGVTGVLAVELFETPERGEGFVINELAMRPHNTGHWSMDGACTGQFEQHLRAVADLPLGSPERIADVAVMKNYFGATIEDTYSQLPEALQRAPKVKVHHYGKSVRPGRKIGHVNVIGRAEDLESLRTQARQAASLLAFGSVEPPQ